MKFIPENISHICHENEIYEKVLSLDGKRILELGCGKAMITRGIATTGDNRQIVATEVDETQHQLNLKLTDLPNVNFVLAGAQDIPESDASFDIVLMFKSLHHVPQDMMEKSLQEIHRVLKKGGIAYISEPIFDGDFNELIRMFHDEEIVRKAAFAAIKASLARDDFELVEEITFNTPRHYDDFDDFNRRFLQVTHTDHELSDELLTTVREKFQSSMTENGAEYLTPVRVDILRKK